MHHFGILVDVKCGKLIDNSTGLIVQGKINRKMTISPVILKDAMDPYTDLLKGFPNITRPVFSNDRVTHDVTHHIQTRGPPVSAHPHRLKPDHLKVAKQ